MRSEEAVAAYKELSARYHTDAWTEPIDVAARRQELSEVLVGGGEFPSGFEYDRGTVAAYIADWSAFLDRLPEVEMSEPIRDRVAEEVRDGLERAAILARGDDEAYSEFERRRVGLPDSELVAEARAVLDGDLTVLPFAVAPSEDEPATTTSAQVQSRMAAALEAYGLDEWHAVEEPNMAAQASVNGSFHRVRVRQGTMFTARSADRLMAHEIGGHVLRWANSQSQPEAWASIALGRTVPTEEGMAAWREVEFGLLTEEQVRVYAARVVGVDRAQREGLADVARCLSDFVGPQQAVEIAVRTKRGLADPNAPGGMAKDWGYLAGLLVMADLAGNAPESLRILAGVKWPVDDLASILALYDAGHIVEPGLVPDREKLGLG